MRRQKRANVPTAVRPISKPFRVDVPTCQRCSSRGSRGVRRHKAADCVGLQDQTPKPIPNAQRLGFTRCRATKSPTTYKCLRRRISSEKPGGRQSGASRCWVAYCVAMICFAQSAARSSSPSFSGPSTPSTKNPSGDMISSPPFFLSLSEIGLAA